MDMVQKKRIKWIDYAKMIGIVLVVFGHALPGCELEKWIYSFHMPLFFFLSGITLKNDRGYIEYVQKLARRLLVPYCQFSVLWLLYFICEKYLFHEHIELVNKVIGFFVQWRGTDWQLGLWFLPLLFGAETLVAFIIRQNFKLQVCLVLGVTGAGFAYAELVHRTIPWHIDAVMIVAPFIYLGYLYKSLLSGKYGESFLQNSKVTWLLIIFSFIVNISSNACNVRRLGINVDIYEMRYGNPLLYFLSALSGIAFVLLVCQKIIGTKDLKVAGWIGRNTLYIYCIHQIIIGCFHHFDAIFLRLNVKIIWADMLIGIMALILSCLFILIGKQIQKRFRKVYLNLI